LPRLAQHYRIHEPTEGQKTNATAIRLIATDYLNLARDAQGNVDYLRQKRHALLVSLADREMFLRKMPRIHRYSNPATFAAAFEKWYEVFASLK